MIYEGTLAPEMARSRLLESIERIVDTEVCPLGSSIGRRLDAALVATENLPLTANAAVDGYAVHADFLAANPTHAFTIVGRASAGHPFSGRVTEGEAVSIFTGAIMPDGLNAVAMHEHCRVDDKASTLQINVILAPGSNCRPAGENICTGETIIAAGTKLGPADIGIAAAAGHANLRVCRRLVVGLVSMGDEIVEPGTQPAHGQSFDSNRPMLRALVSADGHEVRDFPIVPDDVDALIATYREAFANCDAVISSGGASDGDEDHTQEALRNIGAELIFWRLAMKPGRPMAVGSLQKKRLFCLPGNPVATFVCYRLLAAPALTVMAGGKANDVLRIPLRTGFTHSKSPGRAEYLRVRLEADATGEILMRRHGRRGAGVLSSLTGADGLIEIPVENADVSEGDYLSFIPFREAGL